MAELEAPSVSSKEWKEALYGEALSERTQKTGRVLVLVALATLMVSVFEVSARNVPGFSIDFSTHPDALEMFMGISSLGLLVVFSLRLVTDVLRAREEWLELITYLEGRRVKNAFEKAGEFDKQVMLMERDEPEWDPDPWFENAIKIDEEAKCRIARIEKRIGDRWLPKTARHLRLWLLGGGPLLIGLLAVIHTSGSAWMFFLAVFEILLSG